MGMFGKKFTTQGFAEESILIGERFGIRETGVMVTDPRMPCYKLGIKFGRPDIIKRFLASRRTGFYFAVVRGGMVGAGDPIELIGRAQQEISVADITRLYAFERNDVKALRRAIEVEALPESWKGYFQHRLEKQIGVLSGKSGRKVKRHYDSSSNHRTHNLHLHKWSNSCRSITGQ